MWLYVDTWGSSMHPFGSNLLFTLFKEHFRHCLMNEFSSWHCWDDVFKSCVPTSISYTVFILSSVLWSLFMAEWLFAFGKPESLRAHPPFLLATPLSNQPTAILLPYEKSDNIMCAKTELGHWTTVLENPLPPLTSPDIPTGQGKKNPILIWQHQKRYR